MGSEDFDNAIRAIMAAKREELGEPPTPEELLAYRDGRLDPAARQSVEARLALHPDAARALADLAAFPDVEPAPGTAELSDDEVEERWTALREKLGEVEKSPHPPSPPLPVLQARPPRERGEGFGSDFAAREGGGSLSREAGEGRGGGFRPPPLKLAAAVLLALGIGFLAGRASLPDLPEGAVNVTIAELTPREEGGVRAVSETEISEDSEELVLVLGAPAERDFPDYEAEILDADGARRWSSRGLRPTPLGTFQLAFRRDALPAGTYRIHLHGREGDRKTPLATYDLRLVGD